jgi:hypothetical protein
MHASPTSSSRTGAPWTAHLLILVSVLAPIVTAQNSHERRIQYTGITVLNSVTDFCCESRAGSLRNETESNVGRGMVLVGVSGTGSDKISRYR